jgi:PEP-CTERM motif
MRNSFGSALIALFVLAAASPLSAALVVFNDDLAGFDALAGAPPVALDFDSIMTGTNLAGDSDSGIAFENLSGGTTLEVVNAAATFTGLGFDSGDSDNRLFATSGSNVLSPGGIALVPGPAAGESDGMRLVFDTPVSAFGLDILFQSLDGFSFFGFTVFDDADNVLASNGFIPIPALPNGPDGTSASSAGGSIFLGFVSDSADIARIDFTESDNNAANPDANVGYDSFRFFTAQEVPEPSSLMVLALGLAGIFARARRR